MKYLIAILIPVSLIAAAIYCFAVSRPKYISTGKEGWEA